MTATLAKQFVAAKESYSVQHEMEVKPTLLIGVENCPPGGFKELTHTRIRCLSVPSIGDRVLHR